MGGGGLTISTVTQAAKPIYEQITIQIKSQIASGALAPGDALPSIRLLAKELRISVITTKRAYEDLERDGFIETVAGKGSFVAGRNLELLREHALTQIEERLGAAVELAKQSAVDCSELQKMLDFYIGRNDYAGASYGARPDQALRSLHFGCHIDFSLPYGSIMGLMGVTARERRRPSS